MQFRIVLVMNQILNHFLDFLLIQTGKVIGITVAILAIVSQPSFLLTAILEYRSLGITFIIVFR